MKRKTMSKFFRFGYWVGLGLAVCGWVVLCLWLWRVFIRTVAGCP